MKIGYARISTHDQTLTAQRDALQVAGCERIFQEKTSGAQRGRQELAAALGCMREGDVLVVCKLDRLARSLKQLIETVEAIDACGVGFQSLTEGIDTNTAGGKLTFHIFGALAEFERGLVREGKARGKVGRPRSLDETGLQVAHALLTDSRIPVTEIAQRLHVNPATLYRSFPGGRGALQAESKKERVAK